MKKNKKKGLIIALSVIVLLIVCLGIISSHPFLTKKCEVPEEYVTEIYAQSMGTYSNRVPLLPVCISIESYSGERTFYTIHYFPFGTVGMSYSPTDGFNQEKPLTRLQ
jgi:hypothetical protein